MKRIKILFFIHDLMHGGAEKVLVNLVNNMNPEKYEITVLSLFDEGVHKKSLNKDIRYLSVFRKTFPANSIILRYIPKNLLFRYMIREKYDILVSYLEGSTTRIIGGCPDKDVRKVAWIHVEQNKKNFKRAYLSQKDVIQTYGYYDEIVCVSEEVKKNFYDLSGIRNNVQVLYNVNETERIKELSRKKITNPDFRLGQVNLCGVGKVRPGKGFYRLAQIHKRLMDEGFVHKIFILGIGEEKEKIENYLKENHLEESFIFLGYDENPYKYMAKCSAFVCSSFAEGFSTAATEALILGIPVITTECAGMKEMLGRNNEYGIVTENSEEALYRGLKRLLTTSGLLEKYHEKAIIRGAKFSTKNTTMAVEAFLDGLIQ